jgi:hypothetical protein
MIPVGGGHLSILLSIQFPKNIPVRVKPANTAIIICPKIFSRYLNLKPITIKLIETAKNITGSFAVEFKAYNKLQASVTNAQKYLFLINNHVTKTGIIILIVQLDRIENK